MTQNHPQDHSFTEQRVQDLPFQIIAEAQNNIDQPSNENIPHNFKIRIKSKREPKMKQAIISVPKLNTSQRTKNVRLVNSDQTIMSFDVFVDSHSKKIAHKKRDKFFSNLFKAGCLMQNEVDDDPYMPSASHNVSKTQNVRDGDVNDLKLDITEKLAFRKHFIPVINTTNSPKTFLGQCKGGGCLDPPFSEDTYAYKPASISPITKDLNRDNLNTRTEKFKNNSSDGSTLDSEINKNIRDSVISDSLITYPHSISASKTNNYEENQNSSKEETGSNTRLLDNEFTQLYYMPSKKSIIKKTYEENQNKKNIERKMILEVKDEISLRTSAREIKITGPEFINENLSKDHKLNDEILCESTNDNSKKSLNIKNTLYTTSLHNAKIIDYELKSEAKEIIDDIIRTIIVAENGELEAFSSTIKDSLDMSINTNSSEKIKNILRGISNKTKGLNKNKSSNIEDNATDGQIASSKKPNEESTIDPASQSADIFKLISNISAYGTDLMVTNNKSSFEHDISTKSFQDGKRTLRHSKQSNKNINQLNSSVHIFDNEPEVEIKPSEENIEYATSKVRSPQKTECLEKLTEENDLNNTMPIINNNIDYNAVYRTPDTTRSSTSIIHKYLVQRTSEHKNNQLEYVAKDDKIVKIDEIQQSPRRSVQTLSNNEINNDINEIEKSLKKSNSTPLSEVLSNNLNNFSIDIDNKQNTISDNIYKYDQYIYNRDIAENSSEQDIYSSKFNETTKLISDSTIPKTDTNDVNSITSLKIQLGSESLSNTSDKSTSSKILRKDYDYRQKGQESTNVQECNSTISSIKISENALALLNNSIKSSNSKISRSDLTKSILSGPKDQNDRYYKVVKDKVNEKQSASSKDNFFHEISKIGEKSVHQEKSDKMGLEVIDSSEVVEKNRLFENLNKNLDAKRFEDISSLQVEKTDLNNFSETHVLMKQSVDTSKKSIDLISKASQNTLRNSTKSETYTNNNLEDKTIYEHARNKFSDISFNSLYNHSLTSNDLIRKKYRSPSLYSIEATRNKLQNNINAANSKISITLPDHIVIDEQSEKTKLTYLDSNPILEKFQSSQKIVNASMTHIAKDYEYKLLETLNSSNNLESNGYELNKDLYSEFNGASPSITINLDFHISSNDDSSNFFIRTFDSMLPPDEHLEDKFISIKCEVTENDEEIKIPINSDIDFTLSIKKKTSSRKILNKTNGIHKTFSDGHINNNSLLHDTVNSVYDNLFIPLKEIINSLRQEIKLLSQQQMQVIGLLNKMETKPLRLIDNAQKCKCYKQKLGDMYYG